MALIFHYQFDFHYNDLVLMCSGCESSRILSFCREIAGTLADEHRKRVVIVDTSNEIGGDGDVPHAGIGRARRMQVPSVHMQHNVSDIELRKRSSFFLGLVLLSS